MCSFLASRASVSASHPSSSAIFAAARTTASLSIPTRFVILRLLHEIDNCLRHDVRILDVRVMSRAIDHQFFPVKMSRDPIGFGGGIGKIGVARAHHDQYRRVKVGDTRLARSLRRKDERLGGLDAAGLLEIGDQRGAIGIQIGRRRGFVQRAVIYRPERRTPRTQHRDFKKRKQERRGRNHPRERIDEHDAGDVVGDFGGGPYRGASSHRVAEDEGLAGAEMTNHRYDIGTDERRRVGGPINARLAVAGEVHRDNPEDRGDEFWRKETILTAHGAKTGDADDERAVAAGIVIRDLSLGQFEELRWASCAAERLIGAGRQGRGDRERGGDNDGSSRVAMHYSYLTNLISLLTQEERFASRPSVTPSGRGFYRQLRGARGWKIVVKVGD